MEFNWRSDRITKRFVTEHEAEIQNIAAAEPFFLCRASTYCNDWENPFSEELVNRAGLGDRYRQTFDKSARIKMIQQAAKAFGISLL